MISEVVINAGEREGITLAYIYSRLFLICIFYEKCHINSAKAISDGLFMHEPPITSTLFV